MNQPYDDRSRYSIENSLRNQVANLTANLARYKRLYEAARAECKAAADEIDEWDCDHKYERAVYEHTRLRAELGEKDE